LEGIREGLRALTTPVLIGVCVGLAGIVVVLAALLVLRRAAQRADERIASVVRQLDGRIDELARDLARVLETSEERSRRSGALAELGGSIDLDDVIERALEAAGTIGGVDASLLSIQAAANGRPLVATLGLSREEADREGLAAGPPEGPEARAIAISYRYTTEQLQEAPSLIHSGLAVPLAAEGEALGQLAVFTRSRDRHFGDAELAELEELARRAAPALANARRFREARQQADLDALTGLHNRRYFHETLAREVARAHRYERQLALVVFDLDDFKAVNDRIGHLAGDAVLAEAAERVRDVTRSADIPCRVGGDEFAVILPEASRADADQLYNRIEDALAAHPIGQAGNLRFSAGVAELQESDDAVSFFQRADDALYRAKELGKGRIAIATQAS
jgi:diguanylate cyclase (GGDEF)-like protein